MNTDLDQLARQAAAAAHQSVANTVAGLAAPPSRASAARRRLVAGAAIVVVVGGAIAVSTRDDGSTRIVSGPSGPASPAPSEPAPPPPGEIRLPIPGVVVGTGTTSDGVPWTLYIGGPSNELCMGVEFNVRNIGGSCAGRPGGQPLPEEERYRPLRLDDDRVALHVFGRVPADIAEIEVELGGGTATGRRQVLKSDQVEANDDGFYAVELDREPVAVIGVRADGTSARYPVPGG